MKISKKTKVIQIRLTEKDYQDFEIIKKSTGKSISRIILDNKDYYYQRLRKNNMLAETEQQQKEKDILARNMGYESWQDMARVASLNLYED